LTESEVARTYLEKATKRRRVLDVLMHENAYETVEHMPYVTSVERIGIRKGIRQGIEQATPEGLQHQRHMLTLRHMLTRQVQWRFGTDVAKDSRLLLADMADPQRSTTWPKSCSTAPTAHVGCEYGVASFAKDRDLMLPSEARCFTVKVARSALQISLSRRGRAAEGTIMAMHTFHIPGWRASP